MNFHLRPYTSVLATGKKGVLAIPLRPYTTAALAASKKGVVATAEI